MLPGPVDISIHGKKKEGEIRSNLSGAQGGGTEQEGVGFAERFDWKSADKAFRSWDLAF